MIFQSTSAFFAQKYYFKYPHNYSVIDVLVSWTYGQYNKFTLISDQRKI